MLLSPLAVLAQIGGDTAPDPGADVCDIPVYLDPDGTNNTSGFLVGEEVEDFTLYDTDGIGFNLFDALEEKPVFLMTGSYTCPRFRANLNNLEQIIEDFGDSITVWITYCVEAHPHTDVSPYFGFVNPATSNIDLGIIYDQPDSYQDRINTVSDMLEELDVPAPVLLDTPCNDWWDAYGPAENNAYLIEQDGTVAIKHGWMNNFGLDMHDDLTVYFGGEVDSTSYNGSFYITDDFTTATQYTNLLLAAETDVINDSEEAVQIQVVREIIETPEEWTYSLCFGLCYSPEIDTIQFTVQAGYEPEFTLYHYPDGFPGNSLIQLTFTNLNDPENEYVWVVDASSEYVSVPEHLHAEEYVWSGSAIHSARADCGNTHYLVWNSGGARVKAGRGCSFETGDLPPGVYTMLITHASQDSQICRFSR